MHLPSPEGWKKILDLGYEVQQRGPTPLCFNLMRDLLREEVPASCEHVVLAMTEFSPVVEKLKLRGRRGKLLIDPVDIYGEAIAREYLGLPQPGGEPATAGHEKPQVVEINHLLDKCRQQQVNSLLLAATGHTSFF